jgi:xanthine dehydrogenase accessory factor
MNHLCAILAAYQQSQTQGQQAFLVTVMQTQGSTYRRVGAKMLITDTQQLTGMVSGGCLEQDILCHIQQHYLLLDTLPTHLPFVITYNTAVEADLLWGFGLGCEGIIHLLIEPLYPLQTYNPLEFTAACFSQQQAGIVATAYQVEGDLPIALGSRLLLINNEANQGAVQTNLTDLSCQQAIFEAATQALAQGKTAHFCYQSASGKATFLLEVVQPPPALIVFGAGRDALPLVQFAKQLGWCVTLVDCRASEQTPARFAMADQVILGRREILHQQVAITAQTLAVVMTHNYEDDLEILKLLLNSNARYIGLLGSRQRSQRLLRDLPASSDVAQRLHTPIGLDIGAETPEEIALAIAAEIQVVLSTDSPNPQQPNPSTIRDPAKFPLYS